VRLQHVAIGIAADGAERARSFYGDLLGLEERTLPKGVDAERFIWFQLGEGLDLHLHVLDEADPPAVRAHFCVVVGNDLDRIRSRVEAAGVATRDPRLWAGRAAFFCCDPFDNLIEFAQHAHV
jgi:catechol 2,3-dioxygenase-like lactoylglutathione lyase family enzyme